MTNRTTPAQVRERVELGRLSFNVSEPTPHFSKLEFTVDLLRDIMRPSQYWFMYHPMTAVGYKPTPFGRELLDQLDAINGIQPSLDPVHPTCVFLFVDRQVAASCASPPGANGLPENACLVIEETMIRHGRVSPVRRLLQFA